MTIEERATAYAERYEARPMAETAIRAYIAGATEALDSQWRSVKEELPEEMERVLVWTGDEALVCWFTSMRRFRTTLSCQEIYWR